MNTARCFACGRWYPSRAQYCGQCRRKLVHFRLWHAIAAAFVAAALPAAILPSIIPAMVQRKVTVDVESIGPLKVKGARVSLPDLGQVIASSIPVTLQVSNHSFLDMEVSKASGEIRVSGIALAEFELDTGGGALSVAPGRKAQALMVVRPRLVLGDLLARATTASPTVSVTVFVSGRAGFLLLRSRFGIQRSVDVELTPGG